MAARCIYYCDAQLWLVNENIFFVPLRQNRFVKVAPVLMFAAKTSNKSKN